MKNHLDSWMKIDKQEIAKKLEGLVLEIKELEEALITKVTWFHILSLAGLVAAIIVFVFGNTMHSLFLVLGAGFVRLHANAIAVAGQADVILRNQLIAENQLRYIAAEFLRTNQVSENKS